MGIYCENAAKMYLPKVGIGPLLKSKLILLLKSYGTVLVLNMYEVAGGPIIEWPA